MGDFDENLEEIVNTNIPGLNDLVQEAGTTGGNNHGRKNGKRNQKQEQESNKPEYPTFKYSARFRGALHEAILLNNEPVFLTYKNGHLKTVNHFEEINRILTPPCIEEYPYEPIEFESIDEVKEYEKMAKMETIDTLYQHIKSNC